MRHALTAFLICAASAIPAGVYLSVGTGCAAAGAVVPIIQVIAVAAPYAIQVIADVEQFITAYFAAHPDPAKAAAIQVDLDRAKGAAAALAALANAGVDVSEANYLAAMSAFAQAYADLYAAVGTLPGVALQAPGSTPLKAGTGTMVLVAPDPARFAKAVAK